MSQEKTLSILILSIEGREEYLNRLLNFLYSECLKYNLFDDIQVLLSKDKKGEHSIGLKRNICYQNSTSKYSMSLDDDDILKEKALPKMIHKLKTENPDCLRLEGIYTENSKNPKKFIHSIQFTEYFEKDNVYYRPPNHLNAIRTEYAKQFKFPEINHGEDTDWAMQICRSKILKTESSIDMEYYIYDYVPNKNY